MIKWYGNKTQMDKCASTEFLFVDDNSETVIQKLTGLSSVDALN